MKTITRVQYLNGLACFALAQAKYRQCRELEAEMHKHLGTNDDGHMSDELYDPNGVFDAALERESITVEGAAAS